MAVAGMGQRGVQLLDSGWNRHICIEPTDRAEDPSNVLEMLQETDAGVWRRFRVVCDVRGGAHSREIHA